MKVFYTIKIDKYEIDKDIEIYELRNNSMDHLEKVTIAVEEVSIESVNEHMKENFPDISFTAEEL